MSRKQIPQWFEHMKQNLPRLLAAVDGLGEAVREENSLDARTGFLVQVAGAVAIRSEGSVHSPVRRALEAGSRRTRYITP